MTIVNYDTPPPLFLYISVLYTLISLFVPLFARFVHLGNKYFP